MRQRCSTPIQREHGEGVLPRSGGGAGKDFEAGDALAKHCWVRRRRGLAQSGGTKDRQRGLQGPRYSEQREGRLEQVHVFTVPKDLESIS